MFGTKTLLAVAIATTALSGSAALASPASRPAHAAPMKAKEVKTATTTSCQDHKGKFVKCAKATRTTAWIKPATKAPARKSS